MNTKATGTFFVLLAIAVGLTAASPAFADHAKVTIEPVKGSSAPGCETSGGCFTPMEATLDVGGEVTWDNTDTGFHTFTSGDLKADPDDVGTLFDSGLLDPGESFKHTFDAAGTYPYLCTIHPWMIGTIVVQEAAAEEGDEHMEGDEIMVSIETGSAGAGEMLTVDVTFTDMSGGAVEHVNYDIMATQNGETVLDDKGAHEHSGMGSHTTMALPAAASDTNPVDVTVTFLGFGVNPPFTGPVGQVAEKQVVPEFGTIAVMILGVAIVSIIAFTTRSKLIAPKL